MSVNVTSATKLFPRASDNSAPLTLTDSISSGATTVGVTGLATNYSDGDVVVLTIDPATPSAKQVFTGTVSGGATQVTGVVWTQGSNQSHTASAVIVDYVSATHIDLLQKGLTAQHTQTGAHHAITTDTLTTTGNVSIGGTLAVTGAVSGPLSNPYKFSVYRNAAQTPTNNVIQYDTKSFDTNSNFDITTNKGRYTAPVSGFYQFNVVSIQVVTTAPQDPIITLRKNGVTALASSHFVNMYNGLSTGNVNVAILVQLAASDYVEVLVANSLALDVTSPSTNTFSGFLVSAT